MAQRIGGTMQVPVANAAPEDQDWKHGRIYNRFMKFHEANPDVYVVFKRITEEAKRRGFQHIGAQFVGEVIRWETAIKPTGDIFKMCNDYLAYYARMHMEERPEYKGFFRLRRLKIM